MMERVNSTMICCKNFCKCHNVPPTTILKYKYIYICLLPIVFMVQPPWPAPSWTSHVLLDFPGRFHCCQGSFLVHCSEKSTLGPLSL
jgi:hypothetical protein